MSARTHAFHIDEVLWQNDLALFRSLNGQVPWAERFGAGEVKVLHYDLQTQGGVYLFRWPADYDPFGEHGHGGRCSELVLEGSLVDGEREWGPGSFFYTEPGQRHGPLQAGPEGCAFLLQVDGPLFDEAFLQALLEHGRAARRRL